MFRIALLIAFFHFFTASASNVTPFGLGIFPGILSPAGANQSVIGIRISPLVGIHRDIYGLDVGLTNIALGHTGALQIGLFNYQHKTMTIFGLQLGGLINWNAGNTSGAGLQIAPLLNKNTLGGYFWGAQSALWNHAPQTHLYGTALGFFNQHGYLRGLQLGVINNATDLGGFQCGVTAQSRQAWGVQCGLVANQTKKMIGIQAGAFNIAERVVGIQLGLINRAASLTGLQIGLINIHNMGLLPVFPLINVGF